MLFPSLAFLVFAALFFLLWPWARQADRRRWAFLTGASLFFYGWWDWRFLFLILFSGLLDFWAARAMHRRPQQRRLWLAVSLLGNLGSLSVFKYSGFLAQSLDQGLALLGWETQLAAQLPAFTLLLPVGISFYTFQSLSYTLDVYRGRLRPTPHLLHFMAYLCLFPQLVAGPIVRASSLLGQLETVQVPDEPARWAATRRIVAGFFQKMVLADNLAPFVEQAFSTAQHPDSAWFYGLAVLAFAFQIYFDFAGYSDIAIGLLAWMGYRVEDNFRQPYLAHSLRDFWGRWHISLSTWFRDYVYIPLGGSRRGWGYGLLAMGATMLLSGLWHGAAWHFVSWGAWHAAGLSLERLGRRLWPRRPGWLRPWGHLWTLAVVLTGWVWFRADSAAAAWAFLGRLFQPGTDRFVPDVDLSVYLLLAVAWEAGSALAPRVRAWTGWARWGEPALVAIGIAACVLLRGPGTEFIYFQF